MEESIEIWKDITGYEGLYQVSNLGRVRSLKRDVYKKNGTIQTYKERILKPEITRCGYLIVVLCKDGNKKALTVHRLVALAFIPNEDPKHNTEVNHINEDKSDNRACNLNWMTRSENINWGTGKQRCHQKQINHPDMSKPVKQFSLDGKLVTIWPSIAEARRNGFSQRCICFCCNGQHETHKGFRWEYV